MRIKIVEPGWETFSDKMGPVEFVNGVSVGHVADHDLMNIAASLRVVEYQEDGTTGLQQGFAAEAVRIKNLSVAPDRRIGIGGPDKEGTSTPIAPPAPATKYWTYEELAAIADAKGVSGVREVGTPLGATGRNPAEVIAKILKQQDKLRALEKVKARG